jgi:ATP-dependent RNA helicase DDX5/DBP2
VQSFKQRNKISTFGKEVPNPVETFEETQFPKYILDVIKFLKYTKPTPIQSQCKSNISLGWPIALSGRNLVGIAETGSGKTLAYAIPAIIHINGQRLVERGEGPIVLVMVPTRELAMQIQKECQKFATACQLTVAAVYGGSDRATQHLILQRG